MNADDASRCFACQPGHTCRLTVCALVAAAIGGAAGSVRAADPGPARIASEIRELKRLVWHVKQDEARFRGQRDLVQKHRDHAMRFAAGGKHELFRAGFVALVQMHEQSPGQADLLQMQVSPLPAEEFLPEPETDFVGGTVADLVQFCRQHHLSPRYGSRAQLVISELTRDLTHSADARIADLNERIEDLKAQNIAHTDLLARLMLAAAHCHHCHACYCYGYGYCGGVPAMAPAGLASMAYDRGMSRLYAATRTSDPAATDAKRLRFLTSDELPETRDSPGKDKIAASGRRD